MAFDPTLGFNNKTKVKRRDILESDGADLKG